MKKKKKKKNGNNTYILSYTFFDYIGRVYYVISCLHIYHGYQ
jgi:hypothetical protein